MTATLPAVQTANQRDALMQVIANDKQLAALNKLIPATVKAAGLDAARLTKVVGAAVWANPKLLQCSPQSLLRCVYKAAELGLELNGTLEHCAAVPYWDKETRGQVAQFQMMYKGFMELALRSGQVAAINAWAVYENDHFLLRQGTDPGIDHTPRINGDRGALIGAYAVGRMINGVVSFEFLPKEGPESIEAARRRSKAGTNEDGSPNGMWASYYPAMARKTAVRRLCKYLPLSAQYRDAIDQALEHDNEPDAPLSEAHIPDMEDAPPPTPPPATHHRKRKEAPPPEEAPHPGEANPPQGTVVQGTIQAPPSEEDRF